MQIVDADGSQAARVAVEPDEEAATSAPCLGPGTTRARCGRPAREPRRRRLRRRHGGANAMSVQTRIVLEPAAQEFADAASQPPLIYELDYGAAQGPRRDPGGARRQAP